MVYYVPGFTEYLNTGMAPRATAGDSYAFDPASRLQATAAPTGYLPGALPSGDTMAATAAPSAAPSGLGSRPAAWQGQQPAYSRPTRDLTPAEVQFIAQNGTQGLQFVTNKGNAASIKQKEIGKKGATATSSGFVPLDPNAQYRIMNEKGKDRVLYTGTGEEGLRNVYAMAQDLSATKGKKANWGVEMLDPATGQWSRVADDDPAKKWTSVAGDILGAALPIATAFIPGLNVLGSVLTPALAGAAGAAISGKDPLKGALMGGLSAAGGQFLGPALQGAGIGAQAATALGTGLGTTAGGLATGQNLQNSLLGGVAAGGLSYLGSELLGPKGGTTTGNDGATGALGPTGGVSGGFGDITVTAPSFAGPNLGAALAPAVGGLLPTKTPERQAIDDSTNITVTGSSSAPATNLGAGVAGALPSLTSPSSPTAPDQELIVTAENPEDVVTLGGTVLPVGGSLVPGGNANANPQPSQKPPEIDKDSTLDDIVNYLRLGGLGLGLVGDLFGGGGGSTSPGRIPAGLFGGTRSPTFGAQLPAPNMPGLSSAPRTAADLAGQGLASNIDYYRYGYGPEQSFRSNVAAAPRNTSTAFTGYAEGGYAVGGPGDGRSDEIPAMLSDGEYVIDAETVALLGNGSSKAGAEMLDTFRVNVRKHKGRKLAKGDFSHDAKPPEQYMTKGRSRG